MKFIKNPKTYQTMNKELIEREYKRLFEVDNEPAPFDAFEAGAQFVLDSAWVKVEDRLPEDCEAILVYDCNAAQGCKFTVAIWNDLMNEFHCDDEGIKPTHWQPLPTPPQDNK